MGDEFIKISSVGKTIGSLWDEKGHSNIVQIFVSHNKFRISSIQYQYAQIGSLVLSKRNGDNCGSKFNVVNLDYPREYITCISGQCNDDGGLCSITFGTNLGEYGPFGCVKSDKGEEFCFELGEGRQFGGFHGSATYQCVKSIGVYLKPNTTLDILSLDSKNSC